MCHCLFGFPHYYFRLLSFFETIPRKNNEDHNNGMLMIHARTKRKGLCSRAPEYPFFTVLAAQSR